MKNALNGAELGHFAKIHKASHDQHSRARQIGQHIARVQDFAYFFCDKAKNSMAGRARFNTYLPKTRMSDLENSCACAGVAQGDGYINRACDGQNVEHEVLVNGW